MIKEHFDVDLLTKFVDPNHQCSCNLCGKDLSALVKKETEEALVRMHGHKNPQAAQDSVVSINAEEIKNLTEENENLKLSVQSL